jgi:hypothetical protein
MKNKILINTYNYNSSGLYFFYFYNLKIFRNKPKILNKTVDTLNL